MITFFILIIVLVAAVFLFLQQDKFGTLAKTDRLSIIKKSINYRDGKFINESFTPDLAEGVTYYKVIKNYCCPRYT